MEQFPSYRDQRTAFVESLTAQGALRSPAWIEAFTDIPRHLFVPRFFTPMPDGRWQSIGEASGEYAKWVYADETLTTQLNGSILPDSKATEPVEGTPTSSSTQPSLMAEMLEALDIEGNDLVAPLDIAGGEMVGEIGTATGYNLSLLCHRVSDRNVISWEIDPELVSLARMKVNMCGFDPAIRGEDGQAGVARTEDLARLIATCSVRQIPQSWITKVTNGGVIVVSLWRELGGGPLLKLLVKNGTAEGGFLDIPGGFMPVRDFRITEVKPRLRAAMKQDGEKRHAKLDGSILQDHNAGLWLALFVPGASWLVIQREDGGESLWLFGPNGSWSVLDNLSGEVEQYGPRRLWDEIEIAYDRWIRFGSPARTKLGLTVGASNEHKFWVESPQNIIPED